MKVANIFKNIWFRTSIIVLISFLLAVCVRREILTYSDVLPIENNMDFIASDLYSATLHRSPIHRKSKEVVIVSANDCTREEIYRCAKKVLNFSPSLVAFDIIFEFPHPSDSILNQLLVHDRLVFASYLLDVDSSANASGIDQSCFYGYDNYKTGVINLMTTSSNVIREFRPLFTLKGKEVYNCFAGEIVKLYNPSKLETLVKRNTDSLPISYHKVDFEEIPLKQLLNGDIQCDVFKDKIVIIGVTNDPSDQFDTPIGHNYPGVLIHANIVDTILQENYITDCRNWFNYIISIIVTFVFMIMFLCLKKNVDEFSGIIMRLVQIMILFILYYLGVLLYNSNIYMNCMLPMLTIAFSSIVTDIILGLEHITEKYGKIWVSRLKELL